METLNDHYDSPWKEAIEQYFPEFMTFYFPDAYGGIDWTKEHVFLDQELRAVVLNLLNSTILLSLDMPMNQHTGQFGTGVSIQI